MELDAGQVKRDLEPSPELEAAASPGNPTTPMKKETRTSSEEPLDKRARTMAEGVRAGIQAAQQAAQQQQQLQQNQQQQLQQGQAQPGQEQ